MSGQVYFCLRSSSCIRSPSSVQILYSELLPIAQVQLMLYIDQEHEVRGTSSLAGGRADDVFGG